MVSFFIAFITFPLIETNKPVIMEGRNMNKKIQFYLALTEEEHDKALDWMTTHPRRVHEIKDVGRMESTDINGNPIDVYVIVFSATNKAMMDLSTYMEQPWIPIGSAV